MQYVAFTVLGKNQTGALNEISRLINTCDCNIVDCNAMVLGTEFAGNFLISGLWNAIAKLESNLSSLEKKHNIRCLWQRTEAEKKQTKVWPYSAYVIAPDQMGVIYQLTNFFAEQNININEFSSELYSTRYTEARMCLVTMSISIPEDTVVADLRERFILFCDRCNYDGIIEPEKN